MENFPFQVRFFNKPTLASPPAALMAFSRSVLVSAESPACNQALAAQNRPQTTSPCQTDRIGNSDEGRGNVVSPKLTARGGCRKRFLNLGIVLDPQTSI